MSGKPVLESHRSRCIQTKWRSGSCPLKDLSEAVEESFPALVGAHCVLLLPKLFVVLRRQRWDPCPVRLLTLRPSEEQVMYF